MEQTQLGTTSVPNANTHFRIASNTKTMTAALIILLAQEKKLKFDDPISKYVSGGSKRRQITIANLLDMRTGLYNCTDDPEVSKSLDHNPTKVWTNKEVLDIAFKHPSKAPDKTHQYPYSYNNTNYVLLGLVVEKVGGIPCGKQCRNVCLVRCI